MQVIESLISFFCVCLAVPVFLVLRERRRRCIRFMFERISKEYGQQPEAILVWHTGSSDAPWVDEFASHLPGAWFVLLEAPSWLLDLKRKKWKRPVLSLSEWTEDSIPLWKDSFLLIRSGASYKQIYEVESFAAGYSHYSHD